jgi:hypothetical protein
MSQPIIKGRAGNQIIVDILYAANKGQKRRA